MLLKKSTIVLVLLVLLVGVVAVSASAVNVDNMKKSDTMGYVFKPVKSSDGGIQPMTVSATITQGQTNWHTKTITGYCGGFLVDLNWGNPSNSLRLRIYTPDGAVLGPYYDNLDGRIDGRILGWLSRNGGVAQGTYYYEVYGDRVSGVQSYTI